MQRRNFLVAGAALGGFGLAAQAAQAASESNGVSASEIVIGSTGVLSGPLGSVIKSMLSGADLAFAENRAKGGVYGRSIRLVSLDDELKPEKAVENYEKLLKEHRVFAFFGCVGSGTTAAAAQVLAQSGAPMVGGYAVADSARDKVKNSAYFVRATTGREADVLVQHLTTIGITRIAVAHLDNPGGQEALHLIEKSLATHQLKPLAAAGVKGDASNAAEVAKTLSAGQPQAILMYLGGPLAGEVMKSTWALGSNPTFYGMSIVPADVTFKVVGLRARGLAVSQVVPYPWSEVDPVTREYRRLAEAAKVPLGYYSFEGYLNALVLLEGLRNAGRDLTRPRLHAAMRALKLRLAGMDIDFTTGSATGGRFVDLVQVSETGRFFR